MIYNFTRGGYVCMEWSLTDALMCSNQVFDIVSQSLHDPESFPIPNTF
jgi:hypothetical protein